MLSLSLFVTEGPSPGPIGPPPSATSPLNATPPLQEQMKGEQDRRPPRPVGAIGGERAQRRAPGAGVTGGGPDYGKAFWNLASGKLILCFLISVRRGSSIFLTIHLASTIKHFGYFHCNFHLDGKCLD